MNTSQPYLSLLESAQNRHDHGDYQEAVILAQTATEIFMEQVFDRLFARRDIEYLQLPVERLLYRNFSLGHDKVANLYEALSGDAIRRLPLWSAYKEHTELRNDVIHQGRAVDAGQSARSLESVRALIDHVRQAALGELPGPVAPAAPAAPAVSPAPATPAVSPEPAAPAAPAAPAVSPEPAAPATPSKA